MLRNIAEKVAQGIPVHEAAALTMLFTNDIPVLGLIAHSNSPRWGSHDG